MHNSIIDFFNGNFPLTISLYCILLAGVVVITTLLSRLCVILKEKAHLSDGVVAGLLLGVITSLPELVTCITSVVTTQSGSMGFGDIIGSNIFDIFVLATCLLVCIILFIQKKVNKINFMTLVFTGVGTLFVFLAMVASQWAPSLIWHGFNFFSIFILMSYGGSVYFMTRGAKVKTNNKGSMTEIKQAKASKLFNLDLKWIITLIAIVSVSLIVCSVFLTFTTDSLVTHHWASIFEEGDKVSFGGALLLGVVTSLPEIVCCINLCVNKEYNMVIDTIVGSTTFNLAILVIANIAFACLPQQKDPMYNWNIDNLTQVIICIIMIALMLTYLFVNTKDKKPKQKLAWNIPTLSLTVLSYVSFLIVGFIK